MTNKTTNQRVSKELGSLSLNLECIICGTRLQGKQTRFCSQKCRDRDFYIRNSEKSKRNSKLWAKNNPERHKIISRRAMKRYVASGKFNEVVLKQYRKDKDKWNARSYTNKLYKSGSLNLNKVCEVCGKEGAKLRFEDYATRKDKIIELVNNKKIYFLCDKHHQEAINKSRELKDGSKKS